MKRIIFGFFILLSNFSLSAQEAGFRFENDAENLLYYGVFYGAKLGDIGTFTPDDLETFINLNAKDFDYLPAHATVGAIKVPETPSYIIALKQGLGVYTAYYAPLPIAKKIPLGKNSFLPFSALKPLTYSGGQLFVKQETMAKALPGARIDGRFIDWVSVPEILSGYTAKNPIAIYREDANKRLAIKASEAVSAGKAGTDLQSLKFQSDDKSWYVMAASKSPFVKGSSVLIRVFTKGTVKNNYTFEIPVFEEGGSVLLWTEGFDTPVQVGDFACTGLFLEARMKHELIPQAVLLLLADPLGKVAISVSYSDGSFSEEWQYETLSADDTGFKSGL